LVRCLGADLFRTRDAASDARGGELAVVKAANRLDVSAGLAKFGTELERGAEKKLGAHGFEVVLLQSAFDADKAGGEFLQVFFVGWEVLFLNSFDVVCFQQVDRAAGFLVRFPIEEGGFGDAEFFGDGAVTPAIGAQRDESVLRVGVGGRRIHRKVGEIAKRRGFRIADFRLGRSRIHRRGAMIAERGRAGSFGFAVWCFGWFGIGGARGGTKWEIKWETKWGGSAVWCFGLLGIGGSRGGTKWEIKWETKSAGSFGLGLRQAESGFRVGK